MTGDFEKIAARAAPAIFVLLWSTGFIGTKYVLNSADVRGVALWPGDAALVESRRLSGSPCVNGRAARQ